MIAKLTGKITDIFQNYIILDVNDVGYKVSLSSKLLNQAIMEKESVYYIYSHIKEDAFSLFGFSSKKELNFFEMLLTVSNIGPKTALAVMNLGGVDEIISAITRAEVEYFLSVPRVGRKNAQRIIVELRNKVGALTEVDLTFAESEENKEIVQALTGIGFSKPEIREALKKIPVNISLEEKIKLALKKMGK